jgi:hypothetical protein
MNCTAATRTVSGPALGSAQLDTPASATRKDNEIIPNAGNFKERDNRFMVGAYGFENVGYIFGTE